MSELKNTTQEDEESVLNYINRWRALGLECKERLSESSVVEICINGMNWELLYILSGIKPQNFQELATRAYDMEITINARNKGSTSYFKARERKKNEDNIEELETTIEDVMAVIINMITAVATEDNEEEHITPPNVSFVFDMIRPALGKSRYSVFNRLGRHTPTEEQ
ncbi:hypothetical protein vseg_013365 [Gypsophila vaccaria]